MPAYMAMYGHIHVALYEHTRDNVRQLTWTYMATCMYPYGPIYVPIYGAVHVRVWGHTCFLICPCMFRYMEPYMALSWKFKSKAQRPSFWHCLCNRTSTIVCCRKKLLSWGGTENMLHPAKMSVKRIHRNTIRALYISL